MNQASKIEIARKNPPTIRVLARQIEALKNDAEKVDPRLDRLSEKTKILLESRKASGDELEKINREFLDILEKMQLEHFFERFFASEKIVYFLRDHPDKKIEDLKPNDFPEITIMQDPKQWKNILEDAKKGMAVMELAEKASAHKEPREYLEKKGGEVGKSILDTIKEHPIVFGACLLAGGVALYKFFKKNSGVGDKIVGLASGGISALLGISLFKESFGGSLVDFLGRKLLGEKYWGKVSSLFGGEEKKEKSPDGIERMPLSEAIGNYWEDAKHMLLPLADLAARNQAALAILAAAGFASSEKFRSAIWGGTKLSAKTAWSLTKIPFKMVGRFPITSLFATSAFLLSLDSIKSIEIPKDSENLFKFLKSKMKSSGGYMEGIDLSGISNQHLKIIAEILTGQKKLSEFIPSPEEMVSGIFEKGSEMLALAPEKLVQDKNIEGLESFQKKIFMLDQPPYSKETQAAAGTIDSLIQKIRAEGKRLTGADIDRLKEAVAPLDVKIVSQDGRLKAVIKDEMGVIHFRSICIDPSAKIDQQHKEAQRFFIESEGAYEEAVDSAGKLLTIPWQQLRLKWGELFKNVETKAEAGKIIEQKLKEGWILTASGGVLSLVAEGGTKYIFGPAEIIGDLWNLFPGGKDFSCVELAIDYAEGLLPVAAFGLAVALMRRDWAAIFKGKVFARTLAYPYYGGKAALRHLARPLAPRDFNPKAIFTNPKMRTTSAFEQFVQRWKLRAPLSPETKAIYRNIRDLQKTKNLLARANQSFGKTREALLGEVDAILDEIGFKEKIMRGKGIHGVGQNHKTLEAAIKDVDRATRQQKIALRKIKLTAAKASAPKAAPAKAPTPAAAKAPTPKTTPAKNPNVIDLATERAARRTTTSAGEAVLEPSPPRVRPKLRLRTGRLFSKIRPRIGPQLGKISGTLGVLAIGTGMIADIVEARRAEKNKESAVKIDEFEKNNPKLRTKLSPKLAEAIAKKIDFKEVMAGKLTIERKRGTQIMIFEKGWLSKIIIKNEKGEEIASLKIPDGLRTPIEEIMCDVKQKAPPEYIKVDLTHPDFLTTLSQTPDYKKIKKYLEDTKAAAEKRGLKICVNKHNQKEILFIDKKSGKVKSRISVEILLAEARGGIA